MSAAAREALPLELPPHGAALPAKIETPQRKQHVLRPAVPGAPRGLMLCSLFTLAYRAMRTFVAADVRMHVLGNEASRGMRHSRYCAGFAETDIGFDGSCTESMIELVNREITRHGVDFVCAGDQPATRSLIAMQSYLSVPCFPMPELATYDCLNDKARFTALCDELDILHPPTWLFPDRAAVLAAIVDGRVSLPLVFKPLSLDGNRGVTVVAALGEAEAARIDFRPVLAQQFIEGQDVGASVFADHGRVTAYICHRLRRATYTALDMAEVFTAISRIVETTGASGILNFDMRLAPDGQVYFLECNPRVFYKMPLSMLLGVNFAAHGMATMTGNSLPARVTMPDPGIAVHSPKAIFAALATPWRLTRRDAGMLRHIAADPLPYLRELLHIEWEDEDY